jgi:hypothetical protein
LKTYALESHRSYAIIVYNYNRVATLSGTP